MFKVLFKIGAGPKRSKTVGFETLNESSESSFLVGAVEKTKHFGSIKNLTIFWPHLLDYTHILYIL